MVVQHNLRAMNSNRMLGLTTATQAKSTEKLSSGYKINRAADDAAGLSISEKMRKQIRGLTQASLNAQDGISAVQTAEGALTEVHDMLQRMNELAVKAANGTNSEDDRSYIQNEVDQLVTEIDRVSTTTKFNETYLLKGVDANGDPNLTYTTAQGNLSKAVAAWATLDSDGAGTAALGDQAAADATFTCAGSAGDKYGLATAANTTLTVSLGAGNSFKVGNNSYYLHTGANENALTGKYTAATAANPSTFVFNSENDFANAIKSAIEKAAGNKGDIKSLSVKDNKVKVEAFADVNKNQEFNLQAGADTTQANKIGVDIAQMSARGLGVNGLKVDGKNDTNANAAVDTISDAIKKVSTQRSALGAVQNRLEHTINNLDNVVENTTSAESQIRDTDMATEMVKYSNNNILAQAGQAMLAQSNQANQGVLSLLQ